ENELESNKEKFDINNSTVYPSIMNTKQSFMEFHEKIVTARGEYGNNLTIEVAVYLWYAEKYFNHLLAFIGKYETVHMPSFGAIFYHDIRNWQIAFDNVIVNNINTVPVALETHSGKKWEKEKERILEELWNSSLLKKIIN